MPDEASILREIADEFDRTATACAQAARMADGNAHRPNIHPDEAASCAKLATRARLDTRFYEARAAAARAGAVALEGAST